MNEPWEGSPHLSMVDNQLEEGVHQEDSIRQDAAAVQENRLEREDRNTSINKDHQQIC